MKSATNYAVLILFLILIGYGAVFISDAKPGKPHDICPYSIFEILDGKVCQGPRDGPKYAYTIEDTPKMFWTIVISYSFLSLLLLGAVVFMLMNNPKLLKSNKTNEIHKE